MLKKTFTSMEKDLKELVLILERQLKSKKVIKEDMDKVKEFLDKWK